MQSAHPAPLDAGPRHPGVGENNLTITGTKICGDRLGTGSSRNVLPVAPRVNGPEVRASGDPHGSSDISFLVW
jgi:hypothetical protein